MSGAASSGPGALPGTAAVLMQIIAETQRIAGEATGSAERLRDESRALLAALGGGPPDQVREADALASSAVGALGEASGALAEAVAALRTFLARTT